MPRDRRKYKRRKSLRPCSVECLRRKWSCSGYVLNISKGGVGLDVLKACRVADELSFSMVDRRGKEFSRKGVVVWARKRPFPDSGSLVGLRFA
jgi:hypothetical protein